MSAPGGGYRDELAAAHARIEALERELETLRARLAHREARPGEFEALLRARDEARAAVHAVTEANRRIAMWVLGLGALATVLFTAAIASMGAQGHPLNAAIFGMMLTVGAVAVTGIATSGRVRAARAQLDLATQRMDTAIERSRTRGVRVDAGLGDAARAGEDSAIGAVHRERRHR